MKYSIRGMSLSARGIPFPMWWCSASIMKVEPGEGGLFIPHAN
jgi:hypothetical protein